jgi:hypothetical protein
MSKLTDEQRQSLRSEILTGITKEAALSKYPGLTEGNFAKIKSTMNAKTKMKKIAARAPLASPQSELTQLRSDNAKLTAENKKLRDIIVDGILQRKG